MAFPEIFIEYTDITVTTGALMGSAALPSLPNAAAGRIQVSGSPLSIVTVRHWTRVVLSARSRPRGIRNMHALLAAIAEYCLPRETKPSPNSHRVLS